MTEPFLMALVVLAAVLVPLFWVARVVRQHMYEVSIWDYDTALLFQHGKLLKTLEPGRHRFYGKGYSVLHFDNRMQELVVNGQEMLTADKVTLKLTALATYRIVDAVKLHSVTGARDKSLYSAIQMALREVVSIQEIDAIIEGRTDLAAPLADKVRPIAEQMGLELVSLAIRDLILGGELKKAYAAVVQSRKEALAGLEKARGEAAQLRTLANAARLFESHPQLLQLRYLDALGAATQAYGNTVVFASPEDWAKAKTVE